MCFIDDYGERATIWSDSKVKVAKKAHRCDCCGRTIQPGEPYGKNFCVFDGRAKMEKACAECDEARLDFGYADGHYIPTPSGLYDELRGCVDGGDADSTWVGMLDNMERRMRLARGAA